MGMRFACISHGHLALFEHNLVVGRVNSTQYTQSSEVDLIVVAMTIIIIIIITLECHDTILPLPPYTKPLMCCEAMNGINSLLDSHFLQEGAPRNLLI